MLFQIVSYALLGFIAVGVLALPVALRPRRGLGTVLAVAMIVVGILLTLFTIFWLGLPEIVLGVIVLRMRPRLPGLPRRGPPRWAFVGAAGFNLFFGGIGFYSVGIPAFTGGSTGGIPAVLGAWSLIAIALGLGAAGLAVRPTRLPALLVGIALIVSGAALAIVFRPVFPIALVDIALGALVLRSWRKLRGMTAAPAPPPGPSRMS